MNMVNMKHLTTYLLCVMSFLANFECVNAEDDFTTGAILWEVIKEGTDERSYLLGTMHGTEGVDYAFVDTMPVFKELFDDVATVGVESDLGDIAMIKWVLNRHKKFMPDNYPKYALLPDSIEDFSDVFGNEMEYNYVNDFVSEVLKKDFMSGWTPFKYDKLLPNFTRNFLECHESAITGEDNSGETDNNSPIMDAGIMFKAKIEGKKLLFLESAQYQCELSDMLDSCGVVNMDVKKQGHELYNYCRMLKGDTIMDDSYGDKLDDAYVREDLKTLHKLFLKYSEKFMPGSNYVEYEELMNEATADRNRKWLAAMVSEMSENPCLFAVGALHLPGENGLLELLQKEGYAVKPMRLRR